MATLEPQATTSQFKYGSKTDDNTTQIFLESVACDHKSIGCSVVLYKWIVAFLCSQSECNKKYLLCLVLKMEIGWTQLQICSGKNAIALIFYIIDIWYMVLKYDAFK